MYSDHLQNRLDFGHGLFIFLILAPFWLRETGVIGVFPGFSLARMGVMCLCILITFGTNYILVTGCWFSRFGVIFYRSVLQFLGIFLKMHWRNGLKFGELIYLNYLQNSIRFWSWWGATAIRYPDLIFHLYIVISEEIKSANFSIWKLSSYCSGGIADCCVVKLF